MEALNIYPVMWSIGRCGGVRLPHLFDGMTDKHCAANGIQRLQI